MKQSDFGKYSPDSGVESYTILTQCTVKVEGLPLTSTEDIAEQWKEYSKDLLNPADTPSVEKAESGDKRMTSPSLVVTDVVTFDLRAIRGQEREEKASTASDETEANYYSCTLT